MLSQIDALKKVVEILRNTNKLYTDDAPLNEWRREQILDVLNHMVEVRTKPLTPEQRERKNECARIRRARKREERDAIIFEAIKPFLNEEERTATELAELANRGKYWEERISSDEIHSFFRRHTEIGVECIPPHTVWGYKIRV